MTTGTEGHRVVGFGPAQVRVAGEEVQDGVRLPGQCQEPAIGSRIGNGGAP
jgi:hypothetical protein